MHKLLLYCIIFFISYNSYATHLVGGEMNYRYLEEDLYEITLTVYRDCYLGEPDFDYPGSILVFEGDGKFLGAFNILGNPKTLLPVVIDDECFTAPPNVCVEKKEYIFNGILEANTHGYYLSYQRCCRNNTILNIFDDRTNNVGDSGMNLFAYIPPVSKVINSNPVFVNFPPIAICVNKPLVVDHSARDIDGDSLVYKLCNPTDALSALFPAVNNNNYDTLPFKDVRWRNPYSLTNVLGGSENLKIDRHTGLLTALPTTIGQFVVGICVEEYRDKVFIAETKRDFQFNVSTCGKFSVSSFFTHDTICNSFEVKFKNESIEADKFLWTFSDGSTSTEKNPTHKFPGYGEYEVKLIASSNSGCADTTSKKIVLKEDDFVFNISDVNVCKGERAFLKINATNASVKNIQWLFTPAVYTNNLEYSYLPGQSETVNFEIFTHQGCIYTGSVNVDVSEYPSTEIIVAPSNIIGPQNVLISTTNRPSYNYLWETLNPNTTPLTFQTNLFVEEDQWAYLTVTERGTSCSVRDSVWIKMDTCNLEDKVDITRSLQVNCSGATLSLDVKSDNSEIDWKWLVNDIQMLQKNLLLAMDFGVEYSIRLIVNQTAFCTDTINFDEKTDNPYISMGEISAYNLCSDVNELEVSLPIQSTINYQVSWGENNSVQNDNIINLPLSGKNQSVPIVVTYNDSCRIYDTVNVNFIDISVEAIATPNVVKKGEEVNLSAQPEDYITYQWYPEKIPASPTSVQTLAVVYETTDFIVIVRDENDCQATDTVRVTIKDDRCSEENIFIPTGFTPNGDGVNDIWKVRTDNAIEISVAIYNRWGEKVFESTDLSNGWDGSYKGKMSENGSYAYYLTVICENQLQYFSKGNITLVR